MHEPLTDLLRSQSLQQHDGKTHRQIVHEVYAPVHSPDLSLMHYNKIRYPVHVTQYQTTLYALL